MKDETLEFSTAKGDSTAFVAMPKDAGEEKKGIIVIQEYWGLNDNIKNVAKRYADEGFVAIAPDLYRGKVTDDKNEAARLMENLEIEDGLDIVNNAMITAQEKYGITKFGVTGFCMGGTYALQAACKLEGLSASAPFYGDVPDEFTLQGLKCPVIFISGTKDKWIDPEKVAELERIAKVNTLPIESVKYEADHAFFNDTRPEVYDEEAAKDAWEKVIKFFNENLSPKHVEGLL
jgi:carboxymethylenebutenolidase